jgi:hypothetical protein
MKKERRIGRKVIEKEEKEEEEGEENSVRC